MAIKAAEREGKRHPLSLRVTADVRKGLEEAASAAGRSLTQEAEYRLERTFAEDRVEGSTAQKLMMRSLSRAWLFLEQRIGEGWEDDPAGVAAMRHVLIGIVDHRLPAEQIPGDEDHQAIAKEAIVEANAVLDTITWRKGAPMFNKLTPTTGSE